MSQYLEFTDTEDEHRVDYTLKSAATAGIQEREVELNELYPKMVTFKDECGVVCIHKPYWHETLEQANAHALNVVRAKLASLDKQRKKLLDLLGKYNGL